MAERWVKTRDIGIPLNPHPAWKKDDVMITERGIMGLGYTNRNRDIHIWKKDPENYPFGWSIIAGTLTSSPQETKRTISKLKNMSPKDLLNHPENSLFYAKYSELKKRLRKVI